MPIEVLLLERKPVPLNDCPKCGAPFVPAIRGVVQRSPWPWWAMLIPLSRWRRPHCALICNRCKDVVGWEAPFDGT